MSHGAVLPAVQRPASQDLPPLRELPPLRFPEELPVSARRLEIAEAIRQHRVVIVCGETGSGKTTQLPKICALAGRGRAGLIGHTQPRRIAALSVARRIAEELGSAPGVHVGHKIRFDERIDPGAPIKLMTDGILLAETAADPLLRAYDTVIVDEAHERSLNIDFLLGYLKRLLDGPRRDDLKLVITSATIDAGRFARHFGTKAVHAGRSGDEAPDGEALDDEAGDDADERGVRIEPAPVIEVSGRTYPVEIRYQETAGGTVADDGSAGGSAGRSTSGSANRSANELANGRDPDLPGRIEEAIESLWREHPGDVLVFLPGEREIREAAEHLRHVHARAAAARSGSPWARGPIELLPLYARLPAGVQQRVFERSNGRRIVLATNVAETSLTVPGIRYVVDSGLARVKRYRYRSKVEQLQIEPISRAAADQRAGRCGRVADGVCVRLYDESDYLTRPRFTDPEILRSSLAAVILRMKSLRLDDIGSFPFLDPPPKKAVADGQALLHELGALDERNALTAVGRALARLPVDPRLGRMLLAAHETACLHEVAVIAAALSTQDPRVRPPEAQQAADQCHRRFVEPGSDFLAWLKLWRYWRDAHDNRQSAGESQRRLAQRLEREFLSVRRLREWSDVRRQLLEACRTLKWTENETPASAEAVHRALLTGLLGNLGTKSPADGQYAGTHQTKFTLHPGSALAKKPPAWVMAAEMVDTAKLYARTVARIDAAWIEPAAAHLLRRSTGDAFWSRSAGQAMVHERATLYGLVVYARRAVRVAPFDGALARELLIREGLVAGQCDCRLPFFAHNRKLIAGIEALEQRIRRPELLVDERELFAWYDARLPADVTSMRELERWWRKAARTEPQILHLSREALLRKDADSGAGDGFPRRLEMHGVPFALEYRFEPGASDDGVTLAIPLAALHLVDAVRCEWLVPGMLAGKVQALLKSLPQRLRRHAVPLPAWSAAFAERWRGRAGERALIDAIIADLAAASVSASAVRVQPGDFRVETLPPHLSMNFRLLDAHGAVLAQSRQLAALRAGYRVRAKGALEQAFEQAAIRLDTGSAGVTTDRGEGAGNARAVKVEPRHAGSGGRQAGSLPADGDTARSHAESGAGVARTARVPGAADAVPDGVGLPVGQRFTDWSFGELPGQIDAVVGTRMGGSVGGGRARSRTPQQGAGRSGGTGGTARGGALLLTGYPALVDLGDAVEMRIFDDPAQAAQATRAGIARLFAIALRQPMRAYARSIPDFSRLSLLYAGFGSSDELRAELAAAIIDRLCLVDPLPHDASSFAARVDAVRPRLTLVGQELARLLLAILEAWSLVQKKLPLAKAHPAVDTDVREQLAQLMPKHFLSRTPAARLRELPRYLKAVTVRLERLHNAPRGDVRARAGLEPLQRRWQQIARQRRGEIDTRLEEIRWLFEELRVSLFAQELRTAVPVSVKRLDKAIEALRAEIR